MLKTILLDGNRQSSAALAYGQEFRTHDIELAAVRDMNSKRPKRLGLMQLLQLLDRHGPMLSGPVKCVNITAQRTRKTVAIGQAWDCTIHGIYPKEQSA